MQTFKKLPKRRPNKKNTAGKNAFTPMM